jgi:hypothetical protein
MKIKYKHEICKTKMLNKKYYNNMSINMNMKWNEGHGWRFYLKPMLNRLNVTRGLTFIYAISET